MLPGVVAQLEDVGGTLAAAGFRGADNEPPALQIHCGAEQVGDTRIAGLDLGHLCPGAGLVLEDIHGVGVLGADRQAQPINGHAAAEAVGVECVVGAQDHGLGPGARIGAVYVHVARRRLVAGLADERLAITGGDGASKPHLCERRPGDGDQNDKHTDVEK